MAEKDRLEFSNISKCRTLIMGFAALWIYYFHICPVGIFKIFPLNRIEWYIHQVGFCGVDIFLLLSSLGLFYSFSKKPVRTALDYLGYLKNRFLRIFCILIPVTLIIAFADRWSPLEFCLKVTGLYQLSRDVYSYLWFVPCILIFYIFAPFYFALFDKFKRKFLFTAVAVAVSIALAFLLRPVIRYDLYAIAVRVPIFLLGFCFGYYSYNNVKITLKHWILALVSLAVGTFFSYLLCSGAVDEIIPSNNSLLNLLIAPPLVLILSSFFSLTYKYKFLKPIQMFFAFFGAMSFEIYCVQEWMWGKIGVLELRGLFLQIICFVCVILFSCIIHGLSGLLLKKTS